ncbi:ornithine cyclodeaminase [Enterobacter sp. ABFQC]|uniref:ornithine cyclodeaminase n=1 Tax=Enterobacter sp. ABFQC TaxID=1778656 RepID=UPI00136CFA7B|nr:ornithine cyclodeaminase [Enterobacter sp. ABFQC]MXV05451.1 ornithine cyclodeaminase [Enterobacter sp. ABFQC]
MTTFIDISHMQQLVRKTGVQQFITELTGFIEDDYRSWAHFQKCPRVANHSALGVIELMPTASDTLYGFKYVNGHPSNADKNNLTVMAFGALAEIDTGYPLLLSELTLATALRTAATSVLAAKYLTPSHARTMAVIGNGAQSEFQILAFHTLLGINQFRLYDIDPRASEKLKNNLTEYPGIHIYISDSVAEAVQGVDIITTITADKKNATIITPDMISGSVYINAVGGDCPGKTEIHPDIINRSRVVVEFEPQSRIEGEIQNMPDSFPVTELWEIINGNINNRDFQLELTVFDSVGFAIEDFSTLRYIRYLSEKYCIGEKIELVPQPADPRNLFSFIK